MKTYWRNRSARGPAEICKDIQQQSASPWGTKDPQTEVFIGRHGNIFIQPSEYGIDGYSLTAQDLQELLEQVRKNIDHSRGLCDKPDKPNNYPRAFLDTSPAHCLCCGSVMHDEDCTSMGMQQLDMYLLICPVCP